MAAAELWEGGERFPHPVGAGTSPLRSRERGAGAGFTRKPSRLPPKGRMDGVCLGLDFSEGNSGFAEHEAKPESQAWLGRGWQRTRRGASWGWGQADAAAGRTRCPFLLPPVLATARGLRIWTELSCFLPAQT